MTMEVIDEGAMRDLERGLRSDENPSVQAAQVAMVRRWLFKEHIGTAEQQERLAEMLREFEERKNGGGPPPIPFVFV